ncbi:MAG: TonB-dependent receptor [bacterium]|nr:TonB-dependent receptor [bacterium]
MRKRILSIAAICFLVATLPAFSQANTGKVSGRVTIDGGAAPGVTVTATSPSLQGTRTTSTSANGDYVFAGLPAGGYELTFELEGANTVRKAVKVNVQQNARIDTAMDLSEVVEEIIVTGDTGTISGQISSQTTYEKETIEKLAVARSIEQAVLLAPGVHATGPANTSDEGFAITISGSQSYENLFMVNGVTVNENLRGQAIEFIIEDAVQETTVSTSGISAEYGRFAGGVVNVITKSGGNQLSGSFRVSHNQESWEGKNQLSPQDLDDTLNETYEATLGGRILKDHLWFFVAGRDLEREGQDTLPFTNINLDQTRVRERGEYKLTISPTESHRLIGSLMEREASTANNHFSAVDLTTVNPSREDPEELISGNYTGVLTESFFVEAQYSERDLTIAKGAGALTTERIGGTWFVDLTSFSFIGSPVFCAVCKDQQRNNENGLVKASYFLSGERTGSHDIVGGYDTFSDIVIVENHQSGSDFSVWAFQPFIYRGTEVFPQFTANGPNRLRFDPVENPTQGTDFETLAFFVNDNWRLNDKWSFNLGLRYNENNAVDAGGALVSDDNNISPRVGLAYDVKGDGDLVLNASYGNYSHALVTSGNVGNGAASAGALTTYQFRYDGPDINPDPNAPTSSLTTTDEALAIIFAWFDNVGGLGLTTPCGGVPTGSPCRISLSIPGVGTQTRDALKTPNSDEIAIGATKRLGSKGLVRADIVLREFHDFYTTQVDTTTGQVQNPDGSFSDLNIITNDDTVLKREYEGLHTQFQYRLTDRLNLGGNWTFSNASGNFDGETADNGPLTGGGTDSPSTSSYPELKAFPNFLPSGDLSIDQKHKVRLWLVYDVLQNEHHSLSVSLLQGYNTGTPYGAIGAVASGNFVDLAALGYLESPPTVPIFFSDRDAFHTDDITHTDVAVNYSFNWSLWGKQFEVFVQPEVLNIFNEDGAVFVGTSINDATTTSSLATFNPFTETPVEGVHWTKGSDFGQATEADDHQTPRTFRFSVGFRF